MPFVIRQQNVTRLPPVGERVLCARITCGVCGHHHDFLDAPPDDAGQLSEKAVCGKCRGVTGTIDLFAVERVMPVQARKARHCLFCDLVISEETLSINPNSLHCAAHLDRNPPVQPVLYEPLGTRRQAREDAAASRAAAYFGINHPF